VGSTRTLTLRRPAQIRVEVTGNTAARQSLAIAVTTSGVGQRCDGTPRTFDPGPVSLDLSCSLTEIAGFSGGAVGNAIVQGFWNMGVGGNGVSATYEFREAPLDDLTIDHIEVVQTVQNRTNDSVPLVAYKGTVVRVFPRAGRAPIPDVTGTLSAFDGRGPLSSQTLIPVNGPQHAVVAPDRGNEFHSLDFLLPHAWTAPGNITFRANVRPPTGVTEARTDNNTADVAVEFKVPPDWPDPTGIAFLPICVQPPGESTPLCPSSTVNWRTEFLDKVFPVRLAGINYFRLPAPAWTWPKAITTNNDLAEVVWLLARYFNIIDSPTWADVHQLFGWLPRIPGFNISGYSDPVWGGGQGRVAAAQDTSVDFGLLGPAKTVAHEVAHNLGLRHPKVDATGRPLPGSCSSIDPSAFNMGPAGWPYANGDANEVGFDTELLRMRPADNSDLMSYCPQETTWISPYSYNRLFSQAWTGLRPPPTPAGKSPLRNAEALEWILVSGMVRADGSPARLLPAMRVSAPDLPPMSDPTARYCLRLTGESVSTNFCFPLEFIDAEGNTLTHRGFNFRIPSPSALRRIAIWREGQELAALSGGASAPEVSIVSPVPGAQWSGPTQTIVWTATDADGDDLTYSVQYSPDGGVSWLPLAMDLTTPQFSFPIGPLGGGSGLRVRVQASDGIRVTTAEAGPIDLIRTATLAAQTNTLDFGKVLVGRAATRPLVLRNPGSGPAAIREISISSGEFSIAAPRPSYNVPAGSELPLTLRLVPQAVGLRTARLVAQGPPPAVEVLLTAKAIATPEPNLAVSPERLDFGTVDAGQSRDLPIVLSNLGPGALSVQTLAITGSGLALVNPPATPFQVAAGAERTVTVRLAPAAAGTVNGSLRIGNDDPDRANLTVPLTGIARGAATANAPAIAVSPTSIDFGNANADATATRTLTISNTGAAPLRVSSLTTAAPFSVSPASIAAIAPGATATATITFAPAAAGTFTRDLTMASDDPSRAALVVPLRGVGAAAPAGTANFAGDWNVVSGSVLFQLTITQNGVNVTGVYGGGTANLTGTVSGNVLTANWVQLDGLRGTMTLTLAANNTTFAGTWTCTLNCAVSGTWSGTRQGPPPPPASAPAISLAPSAVDFGAVNVGSAATRTLTITNTGTAALNVTSLAVAGAPFTVTPASFANIAAGAAVNATVSFRPTAPGAASGSLTVASNDPSRATVTVPLSGTGIAGGAASPANFAGQWTTTSSGVSYALTITQNGASVTGA
jgi:hypothetical protein